MTRQEFDTWIETHYDELLKVAYQQTKHPASRGCDNGREAARDAVQSAVARALDSPTLAALAPAKVWPWMVDAVRSVIEHTRRGAKRADKAHKAWAGAFMGEKGRAGLGNHTSIPVREDENTKVIGWGKRGHGRIVAHDPNHDDNENGHGFIGPRGDWKGEYTIAPLGKCPCGALSGSRLEVGRDVERQGYSKRWTVEALLAIEHAVRKEQLGGIARLAGYTLGCVAGAAAVRTVHRTIQVLGCLNGHRAVTGEVQL